MKYPKLHDEIEAYCMELKTDLKYNNNHVIRYIDHFESVNYQYLITENCNSGTLMYEILRRNHKPFQEEEVVEIIYQLILGVSPYHADGRILKNIVPDNILIDDCNVYKIGNYDRIMDTYSKYMAHIGMPEIWYPAPEKFKSELPVGPMVDIWDIGCLAHCLLFGIRHYNCVNLMYNSN